MRRTFVPLACAALISSLAQAQSPAPSATTRPDVNVAASAAITPQTASLTLSAAVDTALAQNPQLRAAAAELDANDGALRQAGLIPNPVLGVDQEDLKSGTRTTTVQLAQTLEMGGKRAARVELAQRGKDIAALDLVARRADIRASAIQAFFDALTAQERVKVVEESLRIANSGVDAAVRRVTAGKVSPTEETRARVAASTARIDLRQAQAELSASLRALSAVMGVAEGTVQRLDGNVEVLPVAPSAPDIMARLPDAPAIRRAQLEVQRADAGYSVARAKGVPDVTVGVGARRDQTVGRTQAVLSVSVPLPFFDRNQGGQLEALRRRDAAQATAQAEELRLRSEVLQMADLLQARKDEVEALRREVLPGAQTAYEAAKTGFELGKFSFLDALDAQRTWLQVRSQYYTAVAQVHRTAAEIDRQLGTTTDRP
ncbi:TolC family protein [Roseateles puraquae]|uniref:Cobalt-zinc-cadmium resistance protein n=1 Tax=Roseateles puraquae TaxID=431059 RepID=A0A254N1H9_9BURK|nr:TolC family protein [Roseateles puraquae]MDG0857335.1 TolC family protein [Roseateles puraquae]OWR02081.1 cobalt-zinc-cadmium resistance protein [Roseateles puraquae]RTL33516.1 MAG: TolC family protein [Burkholderiales bacterium]